MITHIATVADVETFARQLVSEGLTDGFHPDDPFEEYARPDGEPLYSAEEAAFRNNLIEQCFEVCGDDILGLSLKGGSLGFSDLLTP